MIKSNKRSESVSRNKLRISMAFENYLQSILQIEEAAIPVTPTKLSHWLKRLPEGEGLGTSLPSVGGMLRRMAREGLLKTLPDKSVALTAKGRRNAEQMVRRHRLAECMVVDLLGLDMVRAHEEAHRLEHAISEDLETKINDRLGHPTTCPFGHPIPGNGYVSMPNLVRLSEVVTDQEKVIDRVPEDDRVLLEYFVANNIIPGTLVRVIEVAPYRGIIRLGCNGNEIVVGYEVADLVWVRDESR